MMEQVLVFLANGFVAGTLAGCILGGFGAAVMLVGRSYLMRDRAIGRWPRAPGTITSSTYKSEEGSTRNAEGYDVNSVTFVPSVGYQYTVSGQTFTGANVARAITPTSDGDAVKRCIDKYPRGAKVEVFYDPSNPATAYLETRTSGGAVFLLVFGGFFAFIGFGVLALIVGFH